MSDTTTYYHSPVGILKISGTEKYISEVTFKEKEETASEHLSPMLINCVEQLIQYFNGERRQFDFPMNQSGTAFQQDVWNHLLSIPFGRTISYMDLAKMTGDTKATRAVANANGKIILP